MPLVNVTFCLGTCDEVLINACVWFWLRISVACSTAFFVLCERVYNTVVPCSEQGVDAAARHFVTFIGSVIYATLGE